MQIDFTTSDKDIDGIYAFLMKELDSVWNDVCDNIARREGETSLPQFVAEYARRHPKKTAKDILEVDTLYMTGISMSDEEILAMPFNKEGKRTVGDWITLSIVNQVVGPLEDSTLFREMLCPSNSMKAVLRGIVLKLNIRLLSKGWGLEGWMSLRGIIIRQIYSRLYRLAFSGD